MADSPAKFAAEREIAQAQDAMLSGKMSGCAMHLGRAMRAESVSPNSLSEDDGPGSVRKSRAETTQGAPLQPQFNWTPMKGAY